MAQGRGSKLVRIECANCRRRLKVPESARGRKIKCPRCGVTFRLSGQSAAVQAGPAILPWVGEDKTTHLERLGRRNGLIAGGVVVGLVLAALFVMALWSLLV